MIFSYLKEAFIIINSNTLLLIFLHYNFEALAKETEGILIDFNLNKKQIKNIMCEEFYNRKISEPEKYIKFIFSQIRKRKKTWDNNAYKQLVYSVGLEELVNMDILELKDNK